MNPSAEAPLPHDAGPTELRQRLREAEETLEAIRNGDVDAVVVGGPGGQQVYTLENADRPYRVLIEQMQEGAVTLAEDGTVLYCNQRFATLVAARRETLIGESIARFIRDSEWMAFRNLLVRPEETGRSAEFTLCTRAGDDVPVNISIAALMAERSVARMYCGVFTDLTHSRERSHELAAANAQLASEIAERRRAEDSLQLALDAADMGNWDLDLDTETAIRSERCDQIFGRIDPGPFWDRRAMLQSFLEEDRAAVVAAFTQAERAGAIEFEKRIRRDSDGATRWVQVKGRTYYRDDRAVRIAGVISDVTERRQVEEQLHQAQKMEAIGQLTGGIAHDFNNLLMVIGGSLDMLDERIEKSERTSRYLAAARHGVERGGKLNQQLLAFSRRQDLRTEAICIDDLLDSFENLLDRAVGEAVTIDARKAPELWYCRTDPHQLETAIINLAINARDAMPQGGSIRLATAIRSLDARAALAVDVSAGDYVVVSVTDTGVGMAPEVVSHAFEPFFTTKAVGKGTGLGLSQVYGFARQSGGFVTVESEPGHGTTVSIHLPRCAGPESVAPPARPAKEIKGNGTVLVVEDDPDVRMVASTLLENLGYSVLEAETGQAALQVIGQGRAIDLVFTDVIMPGAVNGIDLVRELRDKRIDTPVLLTSGYTAQQMTAEDAVEGLHLLRKPYTQAELSQAVTMVMHDRA